MKWPFHFQMDDNEDNDTDSVLNLNWKFVLYIERVYIAVLNCLEVKLNQQHLLILGQTSNAFIFC